MKTSILFFISLIGVSMYAQQWFDPSCEITDSRVAPVSLDAAEARNILKVVINQAGIIELNGEAYPDISEIAFKELVLDYVTNPNKDKNKAGNPDKIYVLLKSYNNDNTEILDSLKTYIQDVYLYIWDGEAQERYSSTYIDLKCNKRAKVFKDYPLKLILNPDLSKEKDGNNPPKRFGVPPFPGDVIDN